MARHSFRVIPIADSILSKVVRQEWGSNAFARRLIKSVSVVCHDNVTRVDAERVLHGLPAVPNAQRDGSWARLANSAARIGSVRAQPFAVRAPSMSTTQYLFPDCSESEMSCRFVPF
jgi:hypothetical protein